ncbi:ABC transporter ATP-binding protein, partial [Candidatus Pelagibacter ubique]|nr:ABC transporter ATP-binding protein [Candidatus Pelagibacter ubique]
SSLNSLRFGAANLNVLSDEISRNVEITTNNKKYEFLRNIIFKNVTFKYENQKNPTINKINFEIKKGDLIKITGKSGSGKSTLTNLIIGFFEPNEGEILVDGTQMKGCSENWIKKIGLVSQSVFLFNDTVENNIIFGSPTDKIKLKDILNNLNLGESRFSPFSIIEENGKNLSGGEIQRIAIARALYNESDIIIFDEPTSNLDFENAELVEKLINSLTKKKTVIVISHDQKRFNNARLTLNMN